MSRFLNRRWMLGGAMLLLVASFAGCATPEKWVLVSVRDKLNRSPVTEPWLTVTPRGGDITKVKTEKANTFGTARVQLATGPGTKYAITVDAQGYDLNTFELPALDTFFPSGSWRQAEPTRKYPLRPDNTLELMVTIEP